MHDAFWWDVNLGDLLFAGLSVQNATAMVVTCLVFTCLTVCFEGLKVLESKVRRDHNSRLRRAMQGVCSTDRSNLLRRSRPGTSNDNRSVPAEPSILRTRCGIIARQVLLYTTNTSFNYLIMLVVMLFNGYLFLAIIFGITIGYYLFGHISTKYKLESVREKAKVVTVCVPECEEPEGSTPPLLQGMGASVNNLYNCEARAQTQRLLQSSQEEGTCSQTQDESCCKPGAKKSTDPSKIKKTGEKCCQKRPTENEDGAYPSSADSDVSNVETVVVDVERTSKCCDDEEMVDVPAAGVCAMNSAKNQDV